MTSMLSDAALQARSASGETIEELSRAKPLLVVFLRHSGCPFCREILSRLRVARGAIESSGVSIALVHMMPADEAAAFFAEYGLGDLPSFSDPDRSLYSEFGLRQGGWTQVAGPRVWWQGFKTVVLGGHLPGMPRGDVFQMPGVFLVERGRIVRAHRPSSSAERVDLEEFAACPRGKDVPDLTEQ